MSYNVVDILDKAINLAEKRKEIITKRHNENASIEVMAKVMVKEIDKVIMYYDKLKCETKNSELEEIDFFIYDKISFLMSSFSNKIVNSTIGSPRQFLERSLNIEKDLYAMFIDIRGRFVNNSSDVQSKTYEILTDIIENKANIIKMLEKGLK